MIRLPEGLTAIVAERAVRHRAAFDQARMHLNRLRLFALIHDAVEQHIERGLAERFFWLMDSRQCRAKETRVAYVVVADDRAVRAGPSHRRRR